MKKIEVGILTVSDRCSRNEAEDSSGNNLFALVNSGNLFCGNVKFRECVPDDVKKIKSVLLEWCAQDVNVILTTGGTGFAQRDVTPEAVFEVIQKRADGLSMKILMDSLKVTPLAVLSRPVCGIRGKSLIITLPGSRKASEECLRFVASVIPHAVALLDDDQPSVESVHQQVQREGCHHKHNHCSGSDTISKADIGKVSRRHRKSPYPMISVEEAQIVVTKTQINRIIEDKLLDDSLHHILVHDICAQHPLPPFRASIKDGYAVLAKDGAGSRKVVGSSAAGGSPDAGSAQSGTCVRINTGAPIPAGADAVVQVEDTELLIENPEDFSEIEINILRAPVCGQDIRPIGCDIKQHECIINQGSSLGPPELGLIASVGVNIVSVFKKPVVALLSTGNELMEPGKPLKSGHIYDSNKTMLKSLLNENKIPFNDIGTATDDTSSLVKKLQNAFETSDILVTTGGVSMGDKDILREVLLADFNATIHFAQVFMKPGKPTTFATCEYKESKKMILGLPGNPVSTLVTAHLYLVPLCRHFMGYKKCLKSQITVKLGHDILLDPRPEYHRAILSSNSDEDFLVATSTGHQLSSRLLSFSSGDALLILPEATADLKQLSRGSLVKAILLKEL